MEKIIVSRFTAWRLAREAIRYVHRSLAPKHLRAINAFVTEEDEIFVSVVLSEKAPLEAETFVLAVLGQGHMVEMTLDEFIERSLKAKGAWIGVAAALFPAVKP